jgi:hypothetical protein
MGLTIMDIIMEHLLQSRKIRESYPQNPYVHPVSSILDIYIFHHCK